MENKFFWEKWEKLKFLFKFLDNALVMSIPSTMLYYSELKVRLLQKFENMMSQTKYFINHINQYFNVMSSSWAVWMFPRNRMLFPTKKNKISKKRCRRSVN